MCQEIPNIDFSTVQKDSHVVKQKVNVKVFNENFIFKIFSALLLCLAGKEGVITLVTFPLDPLFDNSKSTWQNDMSFYIMILDFIFSTFC